MDIVHPCPDYMHFLILIASGTLFEQSRQDLPLCSCVCLGVFTERHKNPNCHVRCDMWLLYDAESGRVLVDLKTGFKKWT